MNHRQSKRLSFQSYDFLFYLGLITWLLIVHLFLNKTSHGSLQDLKSVSSYHNSQKWNSSNKTADLFVSRCSNQKPLELHPFVHSIYSITSLLSPQIHKLPVYPGFITFMSFLSPSAEGSLFTIGVLGLEHLIGGRIGCLCS